ncbi:MAG: MarR family transcriptional regulator [Alphaproteobacteria bacterium]|nr:MarR family transcriptional regulator [Alphaproteobacteria bacterium SS10]
MTDISPSADPLFLREENLRRGIEMMFFAYRDFTGKPDEILSEIGLGRAHHRALYFIGRHPGINVSELLSILRITKQSLSRVLSQLIDQEFVEQQTGVQDRRLRLLHLTDKGKDLEQRLTDVQKQRFAAAFSDAGAEAVEGFRNVLLGMIADEDRARFDEDDPGTPEDPATPLGWNPRSANG